jgi:hypothetical protein
LSSNVWCGCTTLKWIVGLQPNLHTFFVVQILIMKSNAEFFCYKSCGNRIIIKIWHEGLKG